MKKGILIPAFAIMVLAQLYIPVNMIMDAENLLRDGKEFLFRTAPIDPNDPFRGKYISLSFDASSKRIDGAMDWAYGNDIYVILTTDEHGFAAIHDITKTEPTETEDYVRADVNYVSGDSTSAHITVTYPFDRFYMEESKAYEAEILYNESARDTNQITYAIVSVKKGDAAVKDVITGGISIREAVMKRKSEQ